MATLEFSDVNAWWHANARMTAMGKVTTVFYFTATGNSLYAARQIGRDDEMVSIAQELRRTERHYEDDAIGIVVPLFGFDLPGLVEELILGSTFETDYFFVVSTFILERITSFTC